MRQNAHAPYLEVSRKTDCFYPYLNEGNFSQFLKNIETILAKGQTRTLRQAPAAHCDSM